MRSLIPARFEGIEAQEGLLPWQPSGRLNIASGLASAAFRSAGIQDSTKVGEYAGWLKEHYIMPVPVTRAVKAALSWVENVSSLDTTHTDAEYTDMIRRFEQGYLGMPPNSSDNGLYWWESSAGGSSGQYPIEYVAQQAAMENDEFLAWIRENSPFPGEFKIKADDFLYSVFENPHSEKVVSVADIRELTPLGNVVVEASLWVFEAGQKSA